MPEILTPPAGFREDPTTGQLACPHRDLFTCPTCAAAHDEIVEVFGQHFWVTDPATRAQLAAA